MEPKLSIGNTGIDKTTKYEGVITAIIDYGYRRRMCLEARSSQDGHIIEEWFDEERLIEAPAQS